jgi:hypothetical protein
MRPINLKAQKIMDRLTAGITRENSHTRIDNNKLDSGFMPVVVEWVGSCKLGDTFSIAHYYEQNGDLMADPEMVFLKAHASGKYFPTSFKQDGLGGIYREGLIWEDGEPKYINAKEQRDEAIFAGTWMENIKWQQFTA